MSGQLVIFTLGTEQYALPIAHVQEIIRYTQPREVAANDSCIRGVISLRGKIVPVCDLADRLGLAGERAENAKIVIVETVAGTVGVIVDEVLEVLTVEESQLDPLPSSGAAFIDAIAKIDDRLVVLLDPNGIFAGVELDRAA